MRTDSTNASRATEAAAATRRAERRNRRTWIGVAVALAAAMVVGIVVAVTGGGHPSAQPAAPAPASTTAPVPTGIPADPIAVAAGRTTMAPWAAPGDATATVHRAGLPMLGAEGTAEHIHAHLDVLVDGRPVTVPALVGIDENAGAISPLHTHDTSGVIHIESPATAPFSLAQFFAEWDVALATDHVGGYAVGNGNVLRAYVNGRQVTGAPGAITLGAHDEIALVYGPADQRVTVPGSYAWPPNL